MSRWGEEESKSKGWPSFLITAGIVGFIIYLFVLNFDNINNRIVLEKKMQTIVRTGLFREETDLKADILNEAQKLDIELFMEDVDLTVTPDGMGNYIVECWIDYPLRINYLIGEYLMDVPIYEKNTLIPM